MPELCGSSRAESSAGPPTRRLVTPCVYSWNTTLASNAVCRLVEVTSPMFMTGLDPSAGVDMLAVPSTVPAVGPRIDPVARLPAPIEVALLEVTVALPEPQQVEEVVHEAVEVEDVEDLLVVARGGPRVERQDAALLAPPERRAAGAEVGPHAVADGAVRLDPGIRDGRAGRPGRAIAGSPGPGEVPHLTRRRTVAEEDVAAGGHPG